MKAISQPHEKHLRCLHNLCNDTKCSDAARHEQDPVNSPVQARADWRKPYLPACSQQRQQEPEGIRSKDVQDNPKGGSNTWRSKGAAGGFPFAKLLRELHTEAQCRLGTSVLKYQDRIYWYFYVLRVKMESIIELVELAS